MLSPASCKIVLLRHGQTDYTDQFPDITSEGKRSLEQAAELISEFAKGLRVKFYSSPKVRTLGSAACLMEVFGLCDVDLIRAPHISACEMRCREEVMALVNRCVSPTNPQAVEEAYWTDERFNDPRIIEPRMQIRERFYEFLDRLIHVGLVNAVPSCYVVLSHVEVLGHLVQDVQALIDADINPVIPHATPIFLTVLQEDVRSPVLIDFEFGRVRTERLDFSRIKPALSCCK
jgi:broad specificity phosphatase PhoE